MDRGNFILLDNESCALTSLQRSLANNFEQSPLLSYAHSYMHESQAGEKLDKFARLVSTRMVKRSCDLPIFTHGPNASATPRLHDANHD